MEPGGTMCFIYLSEEIYLLCVEFLRSLWFISTNCTLCIKYDLNHKFVLLDTSIPYEFNLSSNMS